MKWIHHPTLSGIIKTFPFRVGMTWLLVFVEIVLIALIPLLIGMAIDDLLEGGTEKLLILGGVMVGLTLLAMFRRIYDTRAYGYIRVILGYEVARRNASQPVSIKNARVNMSRELVDFLEELMPDILTASVQLVVSIVILYTFHPHLAYAALATLVGMMAVYALFHKRFYRLNAALNDQMEQQVHILERNQRSRIFGHLRKLKIKEVHLSDSEAVLYGGIFLLQIGFLLFNLWLSASIEGITAGVIFSIITYSWEYIESALMLPVSLQGWTRLSEITMRINSESPSA